MYVLLSQFLSHSDMEMIWRFKVIHTGKLVLNTLEAFNIYIYRFSRGDILVML